MTERKDCSAASARMAQLAEEIEDSYSGNFVEDILLHESDRRLIVTALNGFATVAQPSPAATVEKPYDVAFHENQIDQMEAARPHSSAATEDRLRCRQKLEAEYNDLIYLQDIGSDSIPLEKAMDIAELGLSFIDAIRDEPQPAQVPPSPEFARVVNAMSDWRNADHEDMLTLSRHQAIVILEGVKALSLSRPPLLRDEGDKT